MAIGFSVLFLFLTFFTCFCKQQNTANAISCYVCSSRNYEEKYCFDPFHPVNSTYEQHCKMGKENHIGRFPAHYCVKIIGENVITREALVVRMCSITNFDNQCGVFKFDNETLIGCILTCYKDGCNSSISTKLSKFKIVSFISIFTLIYGLMMFMKKSF